MSASEDIRNLFGKFDGHAQQYHEVSRDDQAVQARTRWPLLSSIVLGEPPAVPAVERVPSTAPARDPQAVFSPLERSGDEKPGR
ncbi:MAG: cellulose biosynthesis protein BcsP [Pararobbsia sp.]